MAETERREKLVAETKKKEKMVGSLGTRLDIKLVETDKRLRELAEKHKVPLSVYRKLLEKAVSKGMVNFEVRDLFKAGHSDLSPELEKERVRRNEVSDKAKKSKNEKAIHHLVAANDSKSLQSIYHIQVEPDKDEIIAWNNAVQELSAALARMLPKGNDGKRGYKTRKLAHNISDIHIKDGWGIYGPVVAAKMNDALKIPQVTPADAAVETDRDAPNPEAGDTKVTGETQSTAEAGDTKVTAETQSTAEANCESTGFLAGMKEKLTPR